ncbi:MAG: hypothetical protein RLZ87_572 [Armatimonadota bacterium]
MILIPVFALIIGAIIAKMLNLGVPGVLGTYLAIACIAGFDTVLGGIRSAYERKFQTDIFVTGFVANVFIAFFIAWLGDKIGTNLYTVVALVMGMRIFSNLSVIRRYLLQEFKDAMTKRQERAAERAAELSETGQTISTEVPEV